LFGTPPNETARIAALDACAVMHTPREAMFDNIVFTVAQLLRVPMSMLSLIHKDVVWAKSSVGPTGTEWQRSQTFCQHVLGGDTLLVEDATADQRFAGLEAVAAEPHIRFALVVPVLGPDRFVVGGLCAFDRSPRTISERQRGQVAQLAAQAGELLRLRVPNLDVTV
jgi:GAF domain-containing protein